MGTVHGLRRLAFLCALALAAFHGVAEGFASHHTLCNSYCQRQKRIIKQRAHQRACKYNRRGADRALTAAQNTLRATKRAQQRSARAASSLAAQNKRAIYATASALRKLQAAQRNVLNLKGALQQATHGLSNANTVLGSANRFAKAVRPPALPRPPQERARRPPMMSTVRP